MKTLERSKVLEWLRTHPCPEQRRFNEILKDEFSKESKMKIKINYIGGKWQFITVRYKSINELQKTVSELSMKAGITGVELCIDENAELEQKTEEETDAVSCSDVADDTSQAKLNIF